MKLLIVEDNDWQADLLKRECAESGFEVSVANNAFAAMELLDAQPFDVIVLDIMLPGSNGLALLHELRSYPDLAQIPVIVVTSSSVTDQNLAPYGVFRVLDKGTIDSGEVASWARKAVANGRT